MPKKVLSPAEVHVLEKHGAVEPVLSPDKVKEAEAHQEEPGIMDALQIENHVPAYKNIMNKVRSSNEAGLQHIADLGMPTSRQSLDDAMQMGSGAAFGPMLSGGVEGAMGGAADKLSDIANSQAVKAFNPAAKDMTELIKSGAGRDALNAGMKPFDSSASLYDKMNSGIADIGENQIRPALKSSSSKIAPEEMAGEYMEPRGIETGERSADRLKAFDELKGIQKQKPELSSEDVYDLKKQYDSQAGYKGSGGVSSAPDKMLADTMRSRLQSMVPEAQGPLKQQQNLIRLRDEVAGASSSTGVPKSAKSAIVKTVGSYGNQIAATTADGIAKVLDSPSAQALGKFAPVLMGARQRGPEAFQATVHVLNQDPEFRKTISSFEK